MEGNPLSPKLLLLLSHTGLVPGGEGGLVNRATPVPATSVAAQGCRDGWGLDPESAWDPAVRTARVAGGGAGGVTGGEVQVWGTSQTLYQSKPELSALTAASVGIGPACGASSPSLAESWGAEGGLGKG